MDGFKKKMGQRPFRFEHMWLLHDGFSELVKECWKGDLDFKEALESFTNDVKVWNKNVFGNVHKEKKRLMARIDGIQKKMANSNHPLYHLQDLERKLQNELDDLLKKEEVLWYQKSKDNWINDGDRNTKYYHIKTVARRKKCRVEMLRNNDGVWEEDIKKLEGIATPFFQNLFRDEDTGEVDFSTITSFSCLEEGDKVRLSADVTDTEVWEAIRSIGAHKSPGWMASLLYFFKSSGMLWVRVCVDWSRVCLKRSLI